ncbi:SH3 domain-containing protein [Methylophilus sp. 14]|uniref:SH3 domain-containing protein n=1 Tax=Methylophilus sp. 14 TaxID=2781019 RepID=UPI00189053C8|nr:SH3 domain-containing protein [Methylophilus sp. 14]MBF4988133.1 SH3 domain-containing protein [Methylophilus sp. 14]
MRTLACVLLLMLYSESRADLASDLRQLRSTISETAKTSKELGSFAGSTEDSRNSDANESAGTTRQGVKEGDILVAKISNIKLFKEPSKKSVSIGTLSKQDEMIYTGNQVDGFYSVTTSNKDDAWVEKILVKKR